MREKVVMFKRKLSVVTCECGEFSIDILVVTGPIQQQILEHAKSHNPDAPCTSVSIFDEF